MQRTKNVVIYDFKVPKGFPLAPTPKEIRIRYGGCTIGEESYYMMADELRRIRYVQRSIKNFRYGRDASYVLLEFMRYIKERCCDVR